MSDGADSGHGLAKWRSAGADGSERILAGLVHRELAIEGRQLEGAALRSHRAGNCELASGVV